MKAANQRFLHPQAFSNLETAALSRQKRVLKQDIAWQFWMPGWFQNCHHCNFFRN
jgi:hypothetical protein